MNPFTGTTPNPLTGGTVLGCDIDLATYRGTDVQRGDPLFAMTRSDLKSFMRCPRKWLDGYESEETKATEWGSLVDAMFLQGHTFERRYAVSPATYQSVGMKCPKCESVTDSKSCRKCGVDRVSVITEKPWDRNANACWQWEQDHSDLTIVKDSLHKEGSQAWGRLMSDPDICELRKCSKSQVMVISTYHDPETRLHIPVKVLIDGLPDKNHEQYGKAIWDLKTARSADADFWADEVGRRGYDMQAAMCLDAYTAATGEDRTDFLHVVQDSDPPYQPAKWVIPADYVEVGRLKYVQGLQQYARCIKDGIWPGYESIGLTRGMWGNWGIIAPRERRLEV